MKGIKVNWKALKLVATAIINWFRNKKGGGMKKLGLVIVIMALCGSVWAEDGITLKQGFIMSWEDQNIKNMTTVNVATTTPVEGWPKWANALWSGNVMEASWCYDGSGMDTVALMFGCKIGTLGDYCPIDFPLKDKIELTVYPLGVMADNLGDKVHFQGASGGAFVSASLKF